MFETNNLRIRAVHNTDIIKLHDLWNDLRVQKTLSPVHVIPLGIKFEETLRSWVSDSLLYCIIETKAESEWVGFVNFFNADKKNRDATLAIALCPEFWGRGYATEVLRFIVDYAFRELALHRVTLNTFGNNLAAIKVYRKVGFVVETIQRKANWSGGKWQDVVSMGILDEEWTATRKED
ncbi:acyl-CoA N-acyltransferase [Lentinula detonsa]|uniref:Acyl-CoA N-acyltransferase n=1 Tax=Lentinula detonsa TaxID=2804962 RepID=A0A9W8U0D1_9AGAR|nr:acyl-CoA N-acyltransferase [Lentinula detonsa]